MSAVQRLQLRLRGKFECLSTGDTRLNNFETAPSQPMKTIKQSDTKFSSSIYNRIGRSPASANARRCQRQCACRKLHGVFSPLSLSPSFPPRVSFVFRFISFTRTAPIAIRARPEQPELQQRQQDIYYYFITIITQE